MGETTTVRLDSGQIAQLDRLVALKAFSSRSEAIRVILSRGIDEILGKELAEVTLPGLEKDAPLNDGELMNIGKILFNKPLSEIIAEERER